VEAQIKARMEKSGRSFDEEAKFLISEKMPSGNFVEIDHLAQTVQFLCSDAASQITGQAIVMDGGWTAQ
jgi:3-hydroxybutyrate dehydrogenase